MKKIRYNIILLVVLSIVILFFVLKDDFNGIVQVLLSSNVWYILLVLICIFINDILKSISMKLLISDKKRNFTLKQSLILTLKTNLFNAITPFSLGGQPFQLYTLKQDDGIGYVDGANILFKDMYVYNIGFTILGIVFYVLNYILNIITINSVVNKFIIAGLIINVILSLFLILIPHMWKNDHKLINKIIGLLNKIKIIKDKEKTINKVDESLDRFKEQIDEIKVNFKLMLKCLILNVLKILVLGVAGYMCFKAINVNIGLIEVVTAIVLIMTMSAFIPIPGGSGGMEFGFLAIFSSFVIGAKLNAALILWRFTGYHLVIIVGLIIIIISRKRK